MNSMTLISYEWSKNRFRIALSEEDERDDATLMMFEHCIAHIGCTRDTLPNDSQQNRDLLTIMLNAHNITDITWRDPVPNSKFKRERRAR